MVIKAWVKYVVLLLCIVATVGYAVAQEAVYQGFAQAQLVLNTAQDRIVSIIIPDENRTKIKVDTELIQCDIRDINKVDVINISELNYTEIELNYTEIDKALRRDFIVNISEDRLEFIEIKKDIIVKTEYCLELEERIGFLKEMLRNLHRLPIDKVREVYETMLLPIDGISGITDDGKNIIIIVENSTIAERVSKTLESLPIRVKVDRYELL